jgi:hypothetical protein
VTIVAGGTVAILLLVLAALVDLDGTLANLVADILLICFVTAMGRYFLTWVRRRRFAGKIAAHCAPALSDIAALTSRYDLRREIVLDIAMYFDI